MSSKVYSAAVVGVDAFEIEIEVHAGWGPEGRVAVVGLPDTAVKESRDRALSALSNSALRRPRGRITIRGNSCSCVRNQRWLLTGDGRVHTN
jgi:magnesium chelatase family protein